MDYDLGVGFTETNVTQYLAELEEYISSLITYVTFKKSETDAAIASLPLEKLEKTQNWKEMTLDKFPYSYEIAS